MAAHHRWHTCASILILASCLAGCCGNPNRVPVSLENAWNRKHFHGLCRYCYPYSCPPCPYFNRAACAWGPAFPLDMSYQMMLATTELTAPAIEPDRTTVPEIDQDVKDTTVPEDTLQVSDGRRVILEVTDPASVDRDNRYGRAGQSLSSMRNRR